MRVRTTAVAMCALAAIASIACEKIIHFDDFGTEPVTVPTVDAGTSAVTDPVCTGLAAKCLGVASASGLRHPPCPKASAVPDVDAGGEGGVGEVYVYAWRRLRLGMNPDPTYTMDAGAYDTKVGYDLDCSNHAPNGLPTTCQAQGLDGGLPWLLFPLGIDNAISQRILGPLNVASYKNDPSSFLSLDDRFSRQLEVGHGSVLTIVYNWNGTANDPKVSVRSVSALGIVGGGNPKWDGTDKWIAATDAFDPDLGNDQIPRVNSVDDNAYVADGVLVSDFSRFNPLKTHIVNNGVTLEVPLYDFHMIGDITRDKLLYAQGFGRWAVSEFIANKDIIAAFLSSCDPITYAVLKSKLTGLGNAAADLPAVDVPDASSDVPCNSISATWAADAERATIGGYQTLPPPSTTNPCN